MKAKRINERYKIGAEFHEYINIFMLTFTQTAKSILFVFEGKHESIVFGARCFGKNPGLMLHHNRDAVFLFVDRVQYSLMFAVVNTFTGRNSNAVVLTR